MENIYIKLFSVTLRNDVTLSVRYYVEPYLTKLRRKGAILLYLCLQRHLVTRTHSVVDKLPSVQDCEKNSNTVRKCWASFPRGTCPLRL